MYHIDMLITDSSPATTRWFSSPLAMRAFLLAAHRANYHALVAYDTSGKRIF